MNIGKAIASVAICAAWAFVCTTEWGCVGSIVCLLGLASIWDAKCVVTLKDKEDDHK